jgi:hypothetical protein
MGVGCWTLNDQNNFDHHNVNDQNCSVIILVTNSVLILIVGMYLNLNFIIFLILNVKPV